MKYAGDGQNLALMELDILHHTGCKWSKIIYPGFKGNKEKALKEINDTPISNFLHTMSPTQQSNTVLHSFNQEFSRRVEETNGSLRRKSSASKTSLENGGNFDNLTLKNQNKPILTNDVIKSSLQREEASERSKLFGPPGAGEGAASQSIMNLRKKILEGNFSEPKSLIGGPDSSHGLTPGANFRKNKLRLHAFDYG